jgi:hypothetical protein
LGNVLEYSSSAVTRLSPPFSPTKEKGAEQKAQRNQPCADEQELHQPEKDVVCDPLEVLTSLHYQSLAHLLDGFQEFLHLGLQCIVQRRARAIG